MSYVAIAKRELCARVIYGVVPGTVYVNQLAHGWAYWPAMPQESVLQVLVPFCPSSKSKISLHEILWYVSHAAEDVSS